MAMQTWVMVPRVNIGAGNGLLPDGTMPLPEPMLNGIHLSTISQEVIMIYEHSP